MVYWTYDSPNMFRSLLCPSSGAWDYTDFYSMWHITLAIAEGCCSSNIPQPGRITYSHAADQRPSINHCVAFSWLSLLISSMMHVQTLTKCDLYPYGVISPKIGNIVLLLPDNESTTSFRNYVCFKCASDSEWRHYCTEESLDVNV